MVLASFIITEVKMSTLKSLCKFALVVILLLSTFEVSILTNNLWCLLTQNNYFIPHQSNVFTFFPYVNAEGSGEGWLYGSDAISFYAIDVDSESQYLQVSRIDALHCLNFNKYDYVSWCSVSKHSY